MTPFQYLRPGTVEEAVGQFDPDSSYIAGGTNLVDLMKEDVVAPLRLIDITRLPLAGIEETAEGGLRIGALVRNAALTRHPRVGKDYPLLRDALLAGASPQLRNMATVGGNLLQRTRCAYFYDNAAPCNKRQPETGCGARNGLNRNHAILGASDQCIAVHPSDMAVALLALGADVLVRGVDGEQRLPLNDIYRLPGETPERDTVLSPGQLITAVELPPAKFARHSSFVKVRDRASYAFALVSAAAGLELKGDTIIGARLALGGVAHGPWRQPSADALLEGERPRPTLFEAAADELLAGAKALAHNGFKIEMARRATVRALENAAGGSSHA